MSQARMRKMDEYFTNVISHDAMDPTDLGSKNVNVQNNSFYSDKWTQSHSKIRFNDTYRSNLFKDDQDNTNFCTCKYLD